MRSGQGSIRLFRFSGIDVFLHWSWFVVAIYEIQGRTGRYTSVTWNVLEYLGLFLIVLTHEFGHALACRQVGGNANRIVLWRLLLSRAGSVGTQLLSQQIIGTHLKHCARCSSVVRHLARALLRNNRES